MLGRALRSLVGTAQTFVRKAAQARPETLKFAGQLQALELPPNVDPNESTRFSPQRAREINASSLLVHGSNLSTENLIDVTLEAIPNDRRVAFYDCNNAVALNSTMQSNVSHP